MFPSTQHFWTLLHKTIWINRFPTVVHRLRCCCLSESKDSQTGYDFVTGTGEQEAGWHRLTQLEEELHIVCWWLGSYLKWQQQSHSKCSRQQWMARRPRDEMGWDGIRFHFNIRLRFKCQPSRSACWWVAPVGFTVLFHQSICLPVCRLSSLVRHYLPLFSLSC